MRGSLSDGSLSEEVSTAFRKANTIVKGKSVLQQDLRIGGSAGKAKLLLKQTRSQQEKVEQKSKSDLISSALFLATAESTNEKEIFKKLNEPCSRMELNRGGKDNGWVGKGPRVPFYRWTVKALFSSVEDLKDLPIDMSDLRAFHFLCIAANVVRGRITQQLFQRVQEEYRKGSQKLPTETGNLMNTSICAGHNPNLRTSPQIVTEILGRRAEQVRLGPMCTCATPLVALYLVLFPF